MCQHGKEAIVKVLTETGKFEKVKVDHCMADLIAAINQAGVRTKYSCCGHVGGSSFPYIMFAGKTKKEAAKVVELTRKYKPEWKDFDIKAEKFFNGISIFILVRNDFDRDAEWSFIVPKESENLHNRLFPQFAQDMWTTVNLNEIAIKNDIDICKDVWIEDLHKSLKTQHSYGGWLEHRNYILRNHYHKDIVPDHFWHLGIDFNVPTNAAVYLPVDAELVYSEIDPDQNGGWGGKLIFEYQNGYFILGHLDRITRMKGFYKRDTEVGKIASTARNGNWYPHLHVQCCRKLDVAVDGYSHYYDGIERDFPDPMRTLI